MKPGNNMNYQKMFCFLPLILLVSTCLTPSLSTVGQTFHQPHDFSHTLVEQLSMNLHQTTSDWPLTYHNDIEDIATSVLIDDSNHIIATGYSLNLSNYVSDFLTVKFDEEGAVLWAKVFDGGMYDYSWGATVDPDGNVIILGFNSTLDDQVQDFNITLFLVKYDTYGNLQWNKTLTFEKDCFPGGIASDSKGNIILTIGSGNLDTLEFFCQTFKYDAAGNEIWNTTFLEDMLSIGSDVVVNDQDEIFITGLTASFFGQGWFAMKYDATGSKQWVQRYSVGNQPYDIELDGNGNIILTGQDYSAETNSSSWLTLKCDDIGNVLWTYRFDGSGHEYPRDLTIDAIGNIYTAGSVVSDTDSRTCVIKQNPEGQEECMKFQSTDRAILRTDIMDDQLIGSGVINASTGDMLNSDFYIDIISDFTPPIFTVSQPEPGYIYLFDRPLFPLGNTAFIIGPMTISIDPDEPNEISKVIFYIDGTVMETKQEAPFEYLWEDSTFGSHIIEIHVYDHELNMKRDVQSVWRIL